MERRRSRTLVIDSAYQSRCGGDWIPSVPSCFSVHRNDDNGDQESRLQYRSRPWSDRTTSHIYTPSAAQDLWLNSVHAERKEEKIKSCIHKVQMVFRLQLQLKWDFICIFMAEKTWNRSKILEMLHWGRENKWSGCLYEVKEQNLHLQLSLLIGGLMCKWEAPPAPVRKITVSAQDAKETQSCRWFAAQESQTASRFSLVHFALWSCAVLAFLDSGILHQQQPGQVDAKQSGWNIQLSFISWFHSVWAESSIQPDPGAPRSVSDESTEPCLSFRNCLLLSVPEKWF